MSTQSGSKQSEMSERSERSRYLLVGLIFGMVLVAFIARAWPRAGIDLVVVQVCVFPFLFLFLSQISILGQKIPRTFLLVGVILGVCAFGFSASHLLDRSRSFIVFRLGDDQYESSTRIFREMTNDIIKRNYSRGSVSRSYSAPGSAISVQKYLRSEAQSIFAVWGSDKWLNISFSGKANLFRAIPLEQQFEQSSGLRFVGHIAITGFSFRPEFDSARFIAALTHSFDELHAKGFGVDRDDRFFALLEEAFGDASSVVGTWTSFAHRSYPLWQLGNVAVLRFFSKNAGGIGDLECAISSYAKALQYLRPGDNPDLAAAILNNKALASYLIDLHNGLVRPKLRALKDLKRATMFSAQANTFHMKLKAPAIARSNLKKLAKGSGFKTSLKTTNKKGKKRKKKLRSGKSGNKLLKKNHIDGKKRKRTR